MYGTLQGTPTLGVEARSAHACNHRRVTIQHLSLVLPMLQNHLLSMDNVVLQNVRLAQGLINPNMDSFIITHVFTTSVRDYP